jgi:hypothetical protein
VVANNEVAAATNSEPETGAIRVFEKAWKTLYKNNSYTKTIEPSPEFFRTEWS